MIGLGAIWGDHGRRRSLYFTTPHFCLKKGWVDPLLSISLYFLFFLSRICLVDEKPDKELPGIVGARGDTVYDIVYYLA